MTTNYERIKNMTIEEMAAEFVVFIPSIRYKDEPEYHYFGANPSKRYFDSTEAFQDGIKWLQAESEGGMKIVLFLIAIINLFIGFHGKIDIFNILAGSLVLGILL